MGMYREEDVHVPTTPSMHAASSHATRVSRIQTTQARHAATRSATKS